MQPIPTPLLYKPPLGRIAKERLAVLRDTNDGFVVAQRDLELRGPGELLGTRQTGLPDYRVANLVRDAELMPQVQRLMQDNYVPVRFAAALAVGDTEYSPAKRSLNKLLKDKDANVIVAAAYAMGKLGSTEHLQILRTAATDSDQMVRANAVLLLGKSGDQSSLKLLWNTMQDKNSDDKVAYQSAEAIARLGDKRIFSKLWTMLISAYHDVRTMGVIAMGKLKTSEAKNALILACTAFAT